MRTRYIVAVGILALLGVAERASGQSASSLREIGPVSLELLTHLPRAADVETAAPDMALGRLLHAAAQNRLEQHQIPLHANGHAILRIIVTGFADQDGVERGGYVLAEVSLVQLARLSSGVDTLAKTWDRCRVALVMNEQELSSAARTEVMSLIDQFANDYLTVNPRS